ncbi:hypothetical protein BGX27_010561 [Mortierella sp. AM989]|nr:hypothetical protein BGX27_010561 [Mortierella sp. AM989]
MSSPISRTDSPTLDDHAKRKREEKQSEGVLSSGPGVEADPEAVPPKKMQVDPEVDSGSVPVSRAEVKQIQRNLKTMPLEDAKNFNNTESKDMDDVESDQGSNEDQTQDKQMEESSQQATKSNGESTPTSDIGDQDTESTIHPTTNEKNGNHAKALSSTSTGFGSKTSGFGSNTSTTSPFGNVKPAKPGESVFGSSSSTSGGFNATSSTSPFSTAEKQSAFGSKSTQLSGGFGNTSAVSPFATAASSTNVFGAESPKSGFGNTSSVSPFATAASSTSAFGGESPKSGFGNTSAVSPFATAASSTSTFGDIPSKSVFGQTSTTSKVGFGTASENHTDSTAGSVFGAKSIVGSVAGASPSLQKPTPFPARLQSTSGGSFSTFGSFSKEGSFTSGSFIDQESSQDQDFGSLLSQDVGDDDDQEQGEGDENFGTGLFTNADQIDVHTGEEDEISIYQTKGKLYADTEKTHAWKERGKGAFKVNISQKDTKSARLVMRTDGALRLILNVAIFPGMNVAVTGDKYIRFIGIEEGNPITFLLKVKDATVAKEIVDNIRRASERQSRGKGGLAVTLKE